MVCLTALLAGIFRVIPGLVEVVVGGGGLVATMFAATEASGCRGALGQGGQAVVLLFGSLMLLSAFVRLLGSGNAREMARHLLVGAAALQLGLFTASPAGQFIIGGRDTSVSPAVLAAVMVVAALVGCRDREKVFPLLGIGLVAVLSIMTLTGNPCGGNAGASLAGSVIFAVVSVHLSSTNDDLDSNENWPNEHTFVTA